MKTASPFVCAIIILYKALYIALKDGNISVQEESGIKSEQGRKVQYETIR